MILEDLKLRKNFKHIEEKYKRVKHPLINDPGAYGDDNNAVFFMKSPITNDLMSVIASTGEGWEHVSVSKKNGKTPTWEEMCFLKDLFFRKDETVIQYHPKKENYVNIKKNCLHLWRKIDQELELPPTWMV